jgi:hypothetical protein
MTKQSKDWKSSANCWYLFWSHTVYSKILNNNNYRYTHAGIQQNFHTRKGLGHHGEEQPRKHLCIIEWGDWVFSGSTSHIRMKLYLVRIRKVHITGMEARCRSETILSYQDRLFVFKHSIMQTCIILLIFFNFIWTNFRRQVVQTEEFMSDRKYSLKYNIQYIPRMCSLDRILN